MVELCAFYYPWQGEDSIDFNGHGYDVNSGTEYPWFFLNVNGKVVGVNIGIVDPSTIPNKEDIVTFAPNPIRKLKVDRHIQSLFLFYTPVPAFHLASWLDS